MTANGRGALWLVVSAAAATALALLIRRLTPEIPVVQIVFVRCALGSLLLLPLVFVQGLPQVFTPHWPLHLLRGLLAWLAITGSFYAFTYLPLFTAMALLASTPLWVVLLDKGWWHKHGAGRLLGVLGGTGVVLLLLATPLTGLLALGSALLFAVTLRLSCQLAATANPATLLFYFALVTTLVSLPPAWWVWQWPGWLDGLLLGLVAGLAALRGLCEWRGYRLASAGWTGLLPYLRVVLAGGVAWLLLAETPTLTSVLGAVLLVAASLYSPRSAGS